MINGNFRAVSTRVPLLARRPRRRLDVGDAVCQGEGWRRRTGIVVRSRTFTVDVRWTGASDNDRVSAWSIRRIEAGR